MTVVDKMARLAMIAHNGVNRKGVGNVPYVALRRWRESDADALFAHASLLGHCTLLH